MDSTTKAFFQQRKEEDPENAKCIDCGAAHPQWASVNLGCYFCLLCSGQHRGVGVHVSFVRSITMDTWSDQQKVSMQKGGNRRLREHLERYGVDRSGRIAQKYNTKAAEYYRQLLRAEVHGEPPPLVLEVAQGNEPAFAPPPKPVEEQPPQFLSGGPPVQEQRPAEDDLVGNLWGGAVSLWGRAREKTFEALDKAHQDGWVPKDHNEFFSNVGDAVKTGWEKTRDTTIHVTNKVQETVNDENFMPKTRATIKDVSATTAQVAQIAAQKTLDHTAGAAEALGVDGLHKRASDAVQRPSSSAEDAAQHAGANGMANGGAAPTGPNGGAGAGPTSRPDLFSDDVDDGLPPMTVVTQTAYGTSAPKTVDQTINHPPSAGSQKADSSGLGQNLGAKPGSSLNDDFDLSTGAGAGGSSNLLDSGAPISSSNPPPPSNQPDLDLFGPPAAKNKIDNDDDWLNDF